MLKSNIDINFIVIIIKFKKTRIIYNKKKVKMNAFKIYKREPKGKLE